ncbi:MAG: hypothetical protein EBS51_15745 [Planctomycetia bacterium]|nr:hypothetical protein [Planctomycetia bacterium]
MNDSEGFRHLGRELVPMVMALPVVRLVEQVDPVDRAIHDHEVIDRIEIVPLPREPQVAHHLEPAVTDREGGDPLEVHADRHPPGRRGRHRLRLGHARIGRRRVHERDLGVALRPPRRRLPPGETHARQREERHEHRDPASQPALRPAAGNRW